MFNENEYIIQGEPTTNEKAKNWRIAIGLQDVDGLKPSNYLIETANKNISGEIDINEAEKRINAYYEHMDVRSDDYHKQEADKVSIAISKILAEDAFVFSVSEFLSIQRRLFAEIADIQLWAGKIRKCNISKKEWALNNDSVKYAPCESLVNALEIDFNIEKNFDFKGLNKKQIAQHIAKFTSDIWQLHPFREGNTRAVAVFIIKYLRMLGFDIGNEQFENHSWYFRNAMVRNNYENLANGIYRTDKFLNMFFENMLLDGENELRNRYLHIDFDRSKVGINATSGNKVGIIAEFVKKFGQITNNDVMNLFDIGREQARKVLVKLVSEGALKAEGGNKNRVDKIKED
ncbi:MAG: Fic family protein [Clostridiales bacterium]|jgi:fido (protein-threonine AMPylation protein)|nr:Fic family protein [Clostridiales bacterium]